MPPSLQIKLRLPSGEIRRISTPSPPSLSSLLSGLSLPPSHPRVTYLDEEGDRIAVSCDEDLREALGHAPPGKALPLLEVEDPLAEKEGPPSPPSPPSPPPKALSKPPLLPDEPLSLLSSLLSLFPFFSLSSPSELQHLCCLKKLLLLLLLPLFLGFLVRVLGDLVLIFWFLVLIKIACLILKYRPGEPKMPLSQD